MTAVEVDAAIQAFEHRDDYVLNREQREAIHMAATNPLSIICGGAGVGKTTTLRAIHEVLEHVGGKVHQMALSGRAAMRLREVTGRPATTIAGFLQAARDRSIDLGLDPLIVIDEASMIDLSTMYRLIRSLQPGCRHLERRSLDYSIASELGGSEVVVGGELQDTLAQLCDNLLQRPDGALFRISAVGG